MAHAAKYSRGALGHMLSHYDRSKDGLNENIDPARTPENYNLAQHQQLSQLDFLHRRLPEVKTPTRKDLNVLCDWVVTLPKDIDRAGSREFMERAYRFMADRYGEQNVISAYVHMDEKTPHMHFAFVPVVEDKQHGGYKVSAKEAITRYELKTFHSDLDRHMERLYGRNIGILNEATREGNKSIEELKREEDIKTRDELRREVARLQPKVADLREEYQELLELRVPVANVSNIEVKPALLQKDMVTVRREDLQTLRKMAEGYAANRNALEHVKGAQKALSEREMVIGDREARLERRESVLEGRERKAEGLLDRFKNMTAVRGSYDELERQRNDLLEKNKTLADERDTAKAENDELRQKYKTLASAYDKLRMSFIDTVQGFRAFFYADEGTGLKARFTDFQRAVFKGISKKAQHDFLSLGDKPAAAAMTSKTVAVDESIIKYAKMEIQRER